MCRYSTPRRGWLIVSETRAWAEPIDGYPGFYRLCVESGDCQSRAVLTDAQLQALMASARGARLDTEAVRRRRDAGNL